MGIDIPDLDDQEFDELFEKARRRIPVYTDEWTDHNRHDTGIAIIELFALLSETHTYQINHISDEERKKYLNLLGTERRPPQPASARIAVDVPSGGDGKVLPEHTELVADDRSGVLKTFETERPATLTEATIECVMSQADGDQVNNTRENNVPNTHFYPFGDNPDSGDALYLGFDGDPFANSDILELDFDLYDEKLPEIASHGDYEQTFEPSVSIAWQYCADYENWRDDDAWAKIPVQTDQTDVFYRGGKLILEKPTGWNIHDHEHVSIHNQPRGLIWIRCQIERPGYEIAPQMNAVRVNVLDVCHRQEIKNELLTRDDEGIESEVIPHGEDGLETTVDSNQTFQFDKSPVLEATISIDGETWTEINDFDTSGPTDKHYLLDRQQGTVTFGDGKNGAKPSVGKHVLAKRYVHGGGTDGNVSKEADWYFADDEGELADEIPLEEVSVSPVQPATGGKKMETIPEAMDRFKRNLKVPHRASTLEDYEYIATHTPGLRFGRAKATTNDQQTPGGDEFKEIRVVIVPYSTHPRPEPSQGFLDAVDDHLQRCRLLGDQVVVQKPNYVNISISLTITALPSYSEQVVIREINEELREYLHPITGFDGDGWPFGRPLYVNEIEDVVATLSSVRSVGDVILSSSGEETIDEYGNVLIADTALLSVLDDGIDVDVQFGPNHRGGER